MELSKKLQNQHEAPEVKVCKKCGGTFLLKDFKMKYGKPQSICKKCASNMEKERYRKKHHRETGVFLDKNTGRIVERTKFNVKLFWSPAMVQYLKTYFPNTPNKEIIEIMGISAWELRVKAKELGLKKDKDYTRKHSLDSLLMAHAASKEKGYPGSFQKGNQTGKEHWFKKKTNFA